MPDSKIKELKPKKKIQKEDDLSDLTQLRLSQDFEEEANVKPVLSKVPVRKPQNQWFFRVHPDSEYRMPCGLIDMKDTGEVYFVHPKIHQVAAGDLTRVELLTCVTRQKAIFLWPIKLPSAGGRTYGWLDSARDVAAAGTKNWVRMSSNMQLQAYEYVEAQDDLGEPEWPSQDFRELLEIAFKGRIISSPDHPVLKNLRGQA